MGYAKDTLANTPNNVYAPHSLLITFALVFFFFFFGGGAPTDTDISCMNSSPQDAPDSFRRNMALHSYLSAHTVYYINGRIFVHAVPIIHFKTVETEDLSWKRLLTPYIGKIFSYFFQFQLRPLKWPTRNKF